MTKIEFIDMAEVKSEPVEHLSGDESLKLEVESEEQKEFTANGILKRFRPKKPKPEHSEKGTFSCPMCPKVWGYPWQLRRHVTTHYKPVSLVTVCTFKWKRLFLNHFLFRKKRRKR